jgi:hypothetical protein
MFRRQWQVQTESGTHNQIQVGIVQSASGSFGQAQAGFSLLQGVSDRFRQSSVCLRDSDRFSQGSVCFRDSDRFMQIHSGSRGF